jgi:thiamine pyrophosphokinase
MARRSRLRIYGCQILPTGLMKTTLRSLLNLIDDNHYRQEDRAIISLNGILGTSQSVSQWLKDAATIIAVDGGLGHLIELAIKPTVMIGDFDSVDEAGARFLASHQIPQERHDVDKDASDFELALRLDSIKGKKHLQIIGGLGGRPDHALFNLHCACQLSPNCLIQFYDGSSLVTLLPPKTGLRLNSSYGHTASLLPLTPSVTNVDFNGVRWPLENATIYSGSSLTLSNQITSADSTLWYEQGMLALFQWKPE